MLPRRNSVAGIFVIAVVVGLASSCTLTPPRSVSESVWYTAWSASIQPADIGADAVAPSFQGQTVRQTAQLPIAASELRIELANPLGNGPLRIDAASVAVQSVGASVVPASIREVRFSGRSHSTIPPGAVVISDPVAIDVPSELSVAISIYAAGETGRAGWNPWGVATTYISPVGNFTATPDLPDGTLDSRSLFWLSAIHVASTTQVRVVALFGDSILNGTSSATAHKAGLVERLNKRFAREGVWTRRRLAIDAAFAGNRLLNAGIGEALLARFDKDVLSKVGVDYVILAIGMNDIAFGNDPAAPSDVVSAEDLVAGLAQLATRARLHGIGVIAATLTPFRGVLDPLFSEAGEHTRQKVNYWIRTTAMFDAVVDFDEVLRDPTDPARLRERFDSGDHVHPNEAGYDALAAAVPLAVLR